jgi:hypothetical protein
MPSDNFCFYLQNRQIQTSQKGGQWDSDPSPFSIPCPNLGMMRQVFYGCATAVGQVYIHNAKMSIGRGLVVEHSPHHHKNETF